MKVLVLEIQGVIGELLGLRIVAEYPPFPVDSEEPAVLMEFQALGLSACVEHISPFAVWRDLRHRPSLDAHDPEIPRGIEGRTFEEFPAFGKNLRLASATDLLHGRFCQGRAVHHGAACHDDHANPTECTHALRPKLIHRDSSRASFLRGCVAGMPPLLKLC